MSSVFRRIRKLRKATISFVMSVCLCPFVFLCLFVSVCVYVDLHGTTRLPLDGFL